MGGGTSKFDSKYNLKRNNIKNIFQKIKYKNNIVGFHPSYNSYDKPEQFYIEKRNLENFFNIAVVEGRQHFLRFKVPTTWQIWEDNKMEIDSTLGYADYEGFRCGTGNEFSVFNILTRKKLELKERPLIVMDGTLFRYRGLSVEEGLKQMLKYKEKCKEYNMPFTILFHNSALFNFSLKGLKDAYDEILKNKI